MERAVYKIGQEVEITKDFELETFTGKKIKVKDGDKGVVTSRGAIRYISGNARGFIEKADCHLKGYDTFNIANMVYKHLERTYAISDFLENEGIEEQDVVEEIETLLSGIL